MFFAEPVILKWCSQLVAARADRARLFANKATGILRHSTKGVARAVLLISCNQVGCRGKRNSTALVPAHPPADPRAGITTRLRPEAGQIVVPD